MRLKKVLKDAASVSRGVLFLIGAEVAVLGFLLFALICPSVLRNPPGAEATASPSNAKKYIKWVDFDVTNEALRQALRYDVDSYTTDRHYNWIELLAYLGAHKKEGQKICGFSMETENMLDNSKAKLAKKNADMIVANNLKVAGAGFGTDTNVVTLITKNGCRQLEKMDKSEVAEKIMDELI